MKFQRIDGIQLSLEEAIGQAMRAATVAFAEETVETVAIVDEVKLSEISDALQFEILAMLKTANDRVRSESEAAMLAYGAEQRGKVERAEAQTEELRHNYNQLAGHAAKLEERAQGLISKYWPGDVTGGHDEEASEDEDPFVILDRVIGEVFERLEREIEARQGYRNRIEVLETLFEPTNFARIAYEAEGGPDWRDLGDDRKAEWIRQAKQMTLALVLAQPRTAEVIASERYALEKLEALREYLDTNLKISALAGVHPVDKAIHLMEMIRVAGPAIVRAAYDSVVRPAVQALASVGLEVLPPGTIVYGATGEKAAPEEIRDLLRKEKPRGE